MRFAGNLRFLKRKERESGDGVAGLRGITAAKIQSKAEPTCSHFDWSKKLGGAQISLEPIVEGKRQRAAQVCIRPVLLVTQRMNRICTRHTTSMDEDRRPGNHHRNRPGA